MQEVLARFTTIYQHQRAAIAEVETHLRAYGYNAECPCRCPADPLAALHAAQQQNQQLNAANQLPTDRENGNGSADSSASRADSPAAGKAAAVACAGGSVAMPLAASAAATVDPTADLTSKAAAGPQQYPLHACTVHEHPCGVQPVESCSCTRWHTCVVSCPARRCLVSATAASGAADGGYQPAAHPSCATGGKACAFAHGHLHFLWHTLFCQPFPQVGSCGG